MRMESDLHWKSHAQLRDFRLTTGCDRKAIKEKKRRRWKMIVCVSPNPNDNAPLLDYSVNFTAR
jgi:hypothetical protein